MNTATHRTGRAGFALGAVLSAFGLLLVCANANADDDRSSEKSVACSSDDGHRHECSADLRGYSVRDIDQDSHSECVVGRNWGYDDRGVWVDDGCRATFKFDRGRDRGDHARFYGSRDSSVSRGDEKRVTCESRDGRRKNCDADLQGYRIADVREISHADCDVGRNFGYDNRGVWVDGGCRGEFIFTATRDRYSDNRDRDDDDRDDRR